MRHAKEVALVFFILLLSAALYLWARQGQKSLRFDFGSMDRDYLGTKEEFHPRLRMNGPIRYPDNTVEVIDFYGRLTRRRAHLRLPYHAFRSPLRMRMRCHRFGLDGTVALSVNGELQRELLFTDRSYPWGTIEAIIPQEVAERAPITIELTTHDFEPSSGHMPEDFGLGIDWVELEPLSRGARIWPSVGQWASVIVFLLLGHLFSRLSGASARSSLIVLCAMVGGICLSTAFFPLQTMMALSRLWIVFPLGIALQRGLTYLVSTRLVPEADRKEIAFLTWLFVAATLGHSLLIFFPNHAPPDLWNHLPQVEWLDSLELSYNTLYRYSTSSDIFDDGHVRPHFGTEYGAPYPPFFYFLTYAASGLHDDIRFLLEFIPVVFGSFMLILVFLISKAIWHDSLAASLAAILFALEISLWHHVHRIHSPGVLGELFVLIFLLFLAAHSESLKTKKGALIFGGLSLATVLSYAAPVVQLAIMMTYFVLLLTLAKDPKEPMGNDTRDLLKGLVGGFALGAGVAIALYYAPYALEAWTRHDALLERQTYDPPATFFVLRNQMRDTVRILLNGYPVYFALSLIGLFYLGRSNASPFHRRLLLACALSYVTMLVLKDPALLPRIFLHAKEDLFYAPIACLLAALPLASLWRKPRWRWSVVALLILLLYLAVRDQALNTNTL